MSWRSFSLVWSQSKETMKTNYTNLVAQLSITEFKLKYAGSFLGYVWTLVKPLMLFGVLYVIFTFFFNLGKGIPNYPAYLLVGVVMWAFFAESTMSGLHTIVSRGDLIKKIDFPKLVIVFSSSVTALLTFTLNLIVIVVVLILSGIGFSFFNLIFLFSVVELFIFILAVAMILSTLFVKFRDFSHIWEVLLQVLFYATPIIYPISYIPHSFSKIIMLNPLAQIFQDARWALVGRNVPTSWEILGWPLNLVPFFIVILTFLFGFWFFQTSSKYFAEEL